MSQIWKNLGKPELQRLIGEKHLERLEMLLPALRKGDFDHNEMYSLDGLTKIFDAFFGNQYILDKKFRINLFNTLPPEKVDNALKAIDIDPKATPDFTKKIEILSSKGWNTREAAHAVSEILGIPEDALPEAKREFKQIEDIPKADRPYKPLKDYQISVFVKSCDQLEPELSRFIVQMPTGSGKTRTAMEIISHYLNFMSGPDDVVLWLAHSEELCGQAFNSFLDIWPHVASKPLKAVRFWGEAETLPYDFSGNAFIVSSFQKLHSKLKKDAVAIGEIKRRTSLIIVDEAHKVLAPTYTEVTKAFISDTARVVGLTATPGRSVANDEENKALANFFFNKIVEIDAPRGDVIEFLRRRKVLSQTEYVPLVTNLEYDLTPKELDYLENFYDLPKGFLDRIGKDDVRNTEIVKRLEEEAKAGKRILFFATSLEQSKFISALLRFIGIPAAHVDGGTPRNQRMSVIEKFKDGDITVLCNYGVLSTGFDAPQTDVVFIARPTSSIVLYSQMIGRGLRGPAIGGTEHCKVIDVVDNIRDFSNENNVYSYFENYYK